MHEIVRVDAFNVLTESQFAFFHIVFLYMLRRDMRCSELKNSCFWYGHEQQVAQDLGYQFLRYRRAAGIRQAYH